MSFSFNSIKQFRVAGLTFNESTTLEDETLVAGAPLAAGVKAAQPATLSVRTDATHGTLTMTNTSHGIVTGQRLDLYWANGQTYNVTAGTVSGVTVPITCNTGGAVLPAASTAVTVGIPLEITMPLVGDNITALAMSTPNKGFFVFASSAPADVAFILLGDTSALAWYAGCGSSNPLAGLTPASMWVSHNNTAAAVTAIQFGALTH